jgi:hypothetical protein
VEFLESDGAAESFEGLTVSVVITTLDQG